MIVLHGIYRFSKKRIGFRNDFCNRCGEAHVAEQFRTFNMWHMFFIPLLPLGYRSRWYCIKCGHDPRECTKESPTLLLLGSFVFLVFGLFMAFGAIFGEKERGMMAGMGLACLAASYGLWRFYKFQAKEPERPVQELQPLVGDTCP